MDRTTASLGSIIAAFSSSLFTLFEGRGGEAGGGGGGGEAHELLATWFIRADPKLGLLAAGGEMTLNRELEGLSEPASEVVPSILLSLWTLFPRIYSLSYRLCSTLFTFGLTRDDFAENIFVNKSRKNLHDVVSLGSTIILVKSKRWWMAFIAQRKCSQALLVLDLHCQLKPMISKQHREIDRKWPETWATTWNQQV